MNKILLYLLMIILSSVAYSQDEAIETEADRLSTHVYYLASDSLEGRFPGSEGIELAARYIEKQFEEIGLSKISGTYRQELELSVGKKLTGNNSVKFNVFIPRRGVPKDRIQPVVRQWESGVDYLPMGFSENGAVSGELVFAGYGITAEKLAYDDYKDVEVTDKTVIVIMDSPNGEEDHGEFAPYTSLRYKAKNARDHGAWGIIFVKSGGDSAHVLLQPTAKYMGNNSGIVALNAQRTKIAPFFPRAKSLYPLQQKIMETKQPQSYVLPNVTIDLRVELEDDMRKTYNILGMVEGTNKNKADEYIVIGAHYDHLGWGETNSSYRGKKKMIHNGADDNASGVAGLIELARRIKENPLERSVIFIAFTAEEVGLVGSNHYVENSIIPVDQAIAMFNLDMIGRLRDNTIKVFGVGTSPLFESNLETIALEDSIIIQKLADGFGPSDHTSFYKKNIPVLFFFTGVHGDYHHPNDDADKLNYEGLSRVVNYVESMTEFIANREEKPEFSAVVEKGQVEKKSRRGKVWFGIVPSFEDSPLGCKISGTSAGSPAAKAGLQKNDIIIEIEGSLIKNLYDFMYRIGDFEAGDEIEVKVLRGHDYRTERTLKVTLAPGQPH